MYARHWRWWQLAAIAASMGMAGNSIFAPGQRMRPVRVTTPSRRVIVRSVRAR